MKARGILVLTSLWLLGACKSGGFPESPAATPSPAPPPYPTVATWTPTTPLEGLAANVTIDRTAKTFAQLPPNPQAVQIRFTGSTAGLTTVSLNISIVGAQFTETFQAADLVTVTLIPGQAPRQLLSYSKTSIVDGSVRTLTVLDTDTLAAGFNYMALGSWEYASPSTPTSAVASAFVAGPATAWADILPLTGTATSYNGVMFGRYADGNTVSSVTAQADATANFVTRQVTFLTTDTRIAGVLNTDLNLVGTLTLGASGLKNLLTGTLSTAHAVPGDRLTGLSEARFYGPAAAEIGGTFFVKNAGDTQQMTGSFGLKQP